MDFTRSWLCKFVASSVALALIWTAPGFHCYEALASQKAAGQRSVPVTLNLSVSGSKIANPSLVNLTTPGTVPGSQIPALPAAPASAAGAVKGQTAALSLGVSAERSVSLDASRTSKQSALVPVVEAVNLIQRDSAEGQAGGRRSADALDAIYLQTPARRSDVSTIFGGANGRLGGRLTPNVGAAAGPADEEPKVPEAKPAESPARQTLWWVFALAGLGAAAGWFGGPHAYQFLAEYLPARLLALDPMTVKIAFSSAGLLAGIALSQRDTWRGFWGDFIGNARRWSANTIRTLGSAGLQFDTVFTGNKHPGKFEDRSLDIRKYPWIAKPAVLISYILVPFIAAIGLAYQLIETPVLALWRGVRQILVEFLPWVIDALEWLGRVIKKAVPFAIGSIWGGVKGLALSGAVGAFALGAPFFKSVLLAEYKAESIPGWAVVRVVQALALVGGLASGALGFAIGLVFGPLYALTESLREGLVWAKSHGRARKALDAWRDALKKEDAMALIDYEFEDKAINGGGGLTRLLNVRFGTMYSAPVLALWSLVAYPRAWARASRYLKTGEWPKDPAKPATAKADEAKVEVHVGFEARKGFALPFALSTIGLVGGAAGFWYALGAGLALPALAPFGVALPVMILGYALSALIGASLGLALSQPQAFKGYFGKIFAEAKETARVTLRAWKGLGLGTDAALRGVPRQPVDAEGRTPWLSWPAQGIGFVGAGFGFAGGALYEALAVPAEAAWLGLTQMVKGLLPFIRRVLLRLRRIAEKFFPFVFGALFGTIAGLFISGYNGGKAFIAPVAEIVGLKERSDIDAEGWEFAGIMTMRVLSIPVFVVAGLAGFAWGALLGIPAALTAGAYLAWDWAKIKGLSGRFFANWLEAAGEELERIETIGKGAGEIQDPAKDAPAKMFARLGNALIGVPAMLPAFLLVSPTAYLRSLSRAKRMTAARPAEGSVYEAGKRFAATLEGLDDLLTVDGRKGRGEYWAPQVITVHFRSKKGLAAAQAAGRIPAEFEGYRVVASSYADREDGAEKAAAAPEFKDETGGFKLPITVVAVLGVAGLLGGLALAHWVAIPALALTGWKLWAAYAAAPIAGWFAGLALSQPREWLKVFSSAKKYGALSSVETLGYWDNAGDSFTGALGAKKGGALSWGHKLLGRALLAVWAPLGALFGASLIPLRSAMSGMQQIIDELVPWLRAIWDTAKAIAKRFFPFVFGLAIGSAVAVVGSAVFGALLLGRPYFKYVAAPRYEGKGLLGFLGKALLMFVAGLLGLVFGAVGLVAGVIASPLFALTLPFSMALQLADVPGPVRRYFDLWSKGSMRTSLRALNKLTNRFEFEDKDKLSLADGWVRVVTVFAVTIMAAFVAAVAGWFHYFRSLVMAARDFKAGKTVPDEADYDDMSSVGRTVKGAVKLGAKAANSVGWLLGWGVGVSLAVAGKLGWGYALLAAPFVGWLGGLVAALVLGVTLGGLFGLISWLASQLEKEPHGETKP